MLIKAFVESETHGKMEFEVMQNNIVFMKNDKGNNVVITRKEGTPIVAALLGFMDAATKVFNKHLEERKIQEGIK